VPENLGQLVLPEGLPGLLYGLFPAAALLCSLAFCLQATMVVLRRPDL
jgi:hypothetical protein